MWYLCMLIVVVLCLVIIVLLETRYLLVRYVKRRPGSLGIDYGEAYAERLSEAMEWEKKNPPEFLETMSLDNLCLKARWWDFNKDVTVLYVHGYGNTGEQATLFAELFVEKLKANILAVDLRGHGNSEGEYIGFGWQDRKDILKWINKLQNIKGNTHKIILFGLSMGAATVLSVSGEKLPECVCMICADCGYSNLNEIIRRLMKKHFRLPVHIFLPIVNGYFQKWYGFKIDEIQPGNQVKKARVPILFIHGKEDFLIPEEMTEKMYQSCNSPKELLIIPNAGHALSAVESWELYQEKVFCFYERSVKNEDCNRV